MNLNNLQISHEKEIKVNEPVELPKRYSFLLPQNNQSNNQSNESNTIQIVIKSPNELNSDIINSKKDIIENSQIIKMNISIEKCVE